MLFCTEQDTHQGFVQAFKGVESHKRLMNGRVIGQCLVTLAVGANAPHEAGSGRSRQCSPCFWNHNDVPVNVRKGWRADTAEGVGHALVGIKLARQNTRTGLAH